jgi:hypothetical protein
VTGTPAVHARRTTYTVTMSDLASSVRAPLSLAVTDTSPPKLRLGGPAVQSVLRQKAVTVRASCNEPCRLSARGTITVPDLGAVALRRARASLEAAGTGRLSLALSAAAQKRLAGWLVRGKRGRAIVAVRAADRAGNASTATRTIVLKK